MEKLSPEIIRAETRIASFSKGEANFCDISDAGTHGLVTSTTGDAMTIDLTGKSAIGHRAFHGHKSVTQQCTIRSLGRVAATASLDGSVQIWDTENTSYIWKKLTFKDFDRALGVAISRDGNTLAVCFQKREEESGAVVLYSLPDYTRIKWWRTKEIYLFGGSIAISDDGGILAHCSKSWAYVLQVVELQKHTFHDARSQKKWRVCGESHVSLSGNGLRLVIADTKSLRLVDLPDSEVYPLGGYRRSFRPFCNISADGTRIVAALADQKFRIWNADTGSVIADVGGFANHTRGCALSKDGNILLCCSFGKNVWVTNIARALEKKREEERRKMNGSNLFLA